MNKKLDELLNSFDKYFPYSDAKMQRDIDEHRKGPFVLKITDAEGAPLAGVRVKAKLKKHEFKFGCVPFMLDGYQEDAKNALYRRAFTDVFNYAIMPLYWDTLEPIEGQPRFTEDAPHIHRRPQLDKVQTFCRENGMRMKGHCLMYNSFNPDWMPREHRALKLAVDRRTRALAERYGDDMEDLDVINEMFTVYKLAYGDGTTRNYPITDDRDHAAWCFRTAQKYFSNSNLYWNEGCIETFGTGGGQYCGDKSVYYLMLKRHIAEGVPIGGIGMQFHAYFDKEWMPQALFNPVRMFDVFETYEEFGLPIQISEVSLPTWEGGEELEGVQAALLRRMYRLWFGRRRMDAIVWWNLADGTAYGTENKFHAGLLHEDLSPKQSYTALVDLIQNEWTTEVDMQTGEDGTVLFSGFYGDYDVQVYGGEQTHREQVCLFRDRVGYHHRTGGLREQSIMVKGLH